MLVLDFKVDYRLKILIGIGISVECIECLNEDVTVPPMTRPVHWE